MCGLHVTLRINPSPPPLRLGLLPEAATLVQDHARISGPSSSMAAFDDVGEDGDSEGMGSWVDGKGPAKVEVERGRLLTECDR